MRATIARPAREIADRDARTSTTLHGRHVEPGDQLTVDGIRGRVAFVQHVTHASGAEWLDVLHVRTGRARSIRPSAVRTVHRVRRVTQTHQRFTQEGLRITMRRMTAVLALLAAALTACSSGHADTPASPVTPSPTRPAARVEYPSPSGPVEVSQEDPDSLTLQCLRSGVVRVLNSRGQVGYAPAYQLDPDAVDGLADCGAPSQSA